MMEKWNQKSSVPRSALVGRLAGDLEREPGALHALRRPGGDLDRGHTVGTLGPRELARKAEHRYVRAGRRVDALDQKAVSELGWTTLRGPRLGEQRGGEDGGVVLNRREPGTCHTPSDCKHQSAPLQAWVQSRGCKPREGWHMHGPMTPREMVPKQC